MSNSFSKISIDTSKWPASRPLPVKKPSPIPYSKAARHALGLPVLEEAENVVTPVAASGWKWPLITLASLMISITSLVCVADQIQDSNRFSPSLNYQPVNTETPKAFNLVELIIMSNQHESGEATASAPIQSLEPSEPKVDSPTGLIESTSAETLLINTAAGMLGGALSFGLIAAARRRNRTTAYINADADVADSKPINADAVDAGTSDSPSLSVPSFTAPNNNNSLAGAGTKALSHSYSSPEDLLFAFQKTFKSLAVKPLNSANAALLSVAGANPENQDYGIGFEFNSKKLGALTAFIIADGCGGHRGARTASFTAVSRAAVALLTNSRPNSLEELALQTIQIASKKVQEVGTAQWGFDEFRTTLIVLISDGKSYALAHIGDGGAMIRRAHGEWVQMLQPHKGAAQNILTASLGPQQMGDISTATFTAQPDDFITLGSDGIFDVVQDPEQFFGWLRNEFAAQKDFEKPLVQFLDGAGLRPEIFDDNLTLALWNNPLQNTAHKKLDAYTTPSSTTHQGTRYV